MSPGDKEEDKSHQQEEDEAEHWTDRQAEESAEYRAKDRAEHWPRTRVWRGRAEQEATTYRGIGRLRGRAQSAALDIGGGRDQSISPSVDQEVFERREKSDLETGGRRDWTR